MGPSPCPPKIVGDVFKRLEDVRIGERVPNRENGGLKERPLVQFLVRRVQPQRLVLIMAIDEGVVVDSAAVQVDAELLLAPERHHVTKPRGRYELDVVRLGGKPQVVVEVGRDPVTCRYVSEYSI